MIKIHRRFLLLVLLLAGCLPLAAQAEETAAPGPTPSPAPSGLSIGAIGVEAMFPGGWTVVTPDTVKAHFAYFSEPSPESAAENLRSEGVYAVAFSSEGDAAMRVIAQPLEAEQALYYDIERFPPEMRSAIKNHFLNKSAWVLTGYRYSAAEWKNSGDTGRMLMLTYTVRYGEETVARGRQAYTARNGLAITLDLQITGSRRLTGDEEKLFAAFVSGTALPASDGMPLLPVGLTLDGVWPEETYLADLTMRGQSTKGAYVSAWIVPEEGAASLIGETVAGNGGAFKLEMQLPHEGALRVYIQSELDGYDRSEVGGWIDYSARRLPVTFTSRPEGIWTEPEIIISGKTLPNVKIQCMEGDTNKKTTTGSGGEFSFKMDRAVTGPRTITLSLERSGFDNRRFEVTFNRQWLPEDYAKYLQSRVQSLSHKNLSENPGKYLGRQVKYTGTILNVSSAGSRVYVQLGIKQNRADGLWSERIIAVADGMDIPLAEGDRASLYIEVTGEFYTFSELTADGDQITVDLPSVRLLTYTLE